MKFSFIISLIVGCFGATDLYELLGITPRASADDIRKGFRQQSLKYHPDKIDPSAASEASSNFIRIREAYDILRDPQKRSTYDVRRRTGQDKHDDEKGRHSADSDIGEVVTTLNQCLDIIRKFSSQSDEGSVFVLIHVFHADERLDGGTWMQKLESSGWFKILHISVFSVERELLDYLGIEKYPTLLLVNGNIRSAPFQPSQRAIYFDLVEAQVKAAAVQLLQQQKHGDTGAEIEEEAGEMGLETDSTTDYHKVMNPYYREITNIGVLNRFPGALELERPHGSGCIRVMYFSSSEDESFEFLMLARQKRKYSFACFFHVVHSSAGFGFSVEGRHDHENTMLLLEEMTRDRHRSYEDEQDVLFERFRLRGPAGLLIYHPIIRGHARLDSFGELRKFLDTYPHEEKQLFREANLATVTDSKFIVLVGVEETGTVFEDGVFDAYSKFCEKIGEDRGRVACYWMRGNTPLGQQQDANTPTTWEQYLKLDYGWNPVINGKHCPTLLLFDGPSRFVSVYEDSRAENPLRQRCFENDRNTLGAGREWWLRNRGRSANLSKGKHTTPRIPPPRYNVFSPGSTKSFLEMFWNVKVMPKLRAGMKYIEDFQKLHTELQQRINGMDDKDMQKAVTGGIIFLLIILAFMVRSIMMDDIQSNEANLYDGESDKVNLAFELTLTRPSLESRWGIALTTQDAGDYACRLNGKLSVQQIIETGFVHKWNTEHPEQAPYRIQLHDVVLSVNGIDTPRLILAEMGQCLEAKLQVVRRASQLYYDFETYKRMMKKGVDDIAKREVAEVGAPSLVKDSAVEKKKGVPMVANPCIVIEKVDTLTKKRWDMLKYRPSVDGRFKEVLQDVDHYYKVRDRVVKVIITRAPTGASIAQGLAARKSDEGPSSVVSNADTKGAEETNVYKVTTLRWMSVAGLEQIDVPIKMSRESTDQQWGIQIVHTTRKVVWVSRSGRGKDLAVGDFIVTMNGNSKWEDIALEFAKALKIEIVVRRWIPDGSSPQQAIGMLSSDVVPTDLKVANTLVPEPGAVNVSASNVQVVSRSPVSDGSKKSVPSPEDDVPEKKETPLVALAPPAVVTPPGPAVVTPPSVSSVVAPPPPVSSVVTPPPRPLSTVRAASTVASSSSTAASPPAKISAASANPFGDVGRERVAPSIHPPATTHAKPNEFELVAMINPFGAPAATTPVPAVPGNAVASCDVSSTPFPVAAASVDKAPPEKSDLSIKELKAKDAPVVMPTGEILFPSNILGARRATPNGSRVEVSGSSHQAHGVQPAGSADSAFTQQQNPLRVMIPQSRIQLGTGLTRENFSPFGKVEIVPMLGHGGRGAGEDTIRYEHGAQAAEFDLDLPDNLLFHRERRRIITALGGGMQYVFSK